MITKKEQQESLRRNLNNATREAISKDIKGVRINSISHNIP